MITVKTPMFRDHNKNSYYLIVKMEKNYSDDIKWAVYDIMHRPFKAKSWHSLKSKIEDDYDYRCLNVDQRIVEKQRRFLEFVGEDRIKEAFEYAWNVLKPNFEDWRKKL